MTWLPTIKVTDQPAKTQDGTSRYPDVQDDGVAKLFTFPMGVKSAITGPSTGSKTGEPGIYQASGIAWSGAAKNQAC